MWNNVLFDKEIPKARLRECLAHVFSVEKDAIAIVGEWEQDLTVPACDIRCVYMCVKGEYKLLVDVIICRESLVPENDLKTVQMMARFLACKCAIPDEGENATPYSMHEVNEKGELFSVELDPRKEDNGPFSVYARKKLDLVP